MTNQSATHTISAKWWLWFVLGMTALSVFVFVDLPLLTTVTKHGKHLATELPVLVPHMVCGFIALCIGPLQFSSRLRQGNVKRHRLLGKIYVCAVIAGAIGGYLLVWGNYSPFGVSVDVLASLWLITAVIAFIAARKRQITHHRQWMIRSYAVTFFFVVDRVPFEFPSFQPSQAGNVCLILTLCILAILIPDISFTWSYLTGPRK
jgi:uncharacterized membrane protein